MTAPLDLRSSADALQAELRDLLCLAVAGDHVRWAVSAGDAELVDWLTDAVPQWRALADKVAKQLVMLGFAPDGRVRSLARDIRLNWVPDGWLRPDEASRLVEYRLRNAAGRARQRKSQMADADTIRLLEVICTSLEAQARSRAEHAPSQPTPG